MKRLLVIVGAGALLVALSGGPALAQGTATATVNVSLTILPYAEVTLDETSVVIIIPAGATYYGPVYVGGTVLCNTSTMLFTRITKPVGAPGDWYSYPVSEIKEPGIHYDEHLLQIMVSNIPEGGPGWEGGLHVSGKSADSPGGVETPPAGQVTLTVVPG